MVVTRKTSHGYQSRAKVSSIGFDDDISHVIKLDIRSRFLLSDGVRDPKGTR